MSCKLTKFQLISRRQVRKYSGPAVAAGAGGFPWVLSDTVPANCYWVVWGISIISSGPTADGLTLPAEILLIPANIKLPSIPAGTTPEDPFFSNYIQIDNAGPGVAGLRIDSQGLGSAQQNLFTHVGDELSMLPNKPYTLIGPGETLLGMMQYYGTPANPGTIIEMRVAFSQCQQTEDFDL